MPISKVREELYSGTGGRRFDRQTRSLDTSAQSAGNKQWPFPGLLARTNRFHAKVHPIAQPVVSVSFKDQMIKEVVDHCFFFKLNILSVIVSFFFH